MAPTTTKLLAQIASVISQARCLQVPGFYCSVNYLEDRKSASKLPLVGISPAEAVWQ
jgi:hypothetical protein